MVLLFLGTQAQAKGVGATALRWKTQAIGRYMLHLGSCLVVAACGADGTDGEMLAAGGSGGTAVLDGAGGSGTGGGRGGAGAGGSGGMAIAPAGGAGAGGAGTGGSGGMGPSIDVGPPHFPNVPLTYTGQDSGGLEVTHSNVVPNPGTIISAFWLVRVVNKGTEPVCSIIISAEFLDAAGSVLATTDNVLSAPMFDSFSRVRCLGPGDEGVGRSIITTPGFTAAQVKRIEYGVSGAIDPDAVKLNDVVVQGLTQGERFGRVAYSGTFVNNGVRLRFPSVDVYPLDAAGKPLEELGAIEDTFMSPGDSWDFETLTLEGDPDLITDVMVFLDYNEQ